MNIRLTTLMLFAALSVLLGACGTNSATETTDGDTTEIEPGFGDNEDPNPPTTGSSDDDESSDTGTDGDTGSSGADLSSAEYPDGVIPAVAEADERVIGMANMGGEIVDPKVHPVDDMAVAESNPEQLMISFTAGDEPCLAATATALASDDQVRVVLEVGITTDALTRSCQAGDFPHTLGIALSEGLEGRQVIIQESPSTESGEPDEEATVAEAEAPGVETPEDGVTAPEDPAPKPIETTLVGMTEQAAQQAAESNGYRWRVMAIDGEDLFGTADYDDGRINAKIVDGTVTETWIG